GCTEDNQLVPRVWEGLRDAPHLFLMMVHKKNTPLEDFCQYLQDIQEVEIAEQKRRAQLNRKTTDQRRSATGEHSIRAEDKGKREHKPYPTKADDNSSKPSKPCWHCIERRIPEKDPLHWSKKCPNLNQPVEIGAFLGPVEWDLFWYPALNAMPARF